MQLDNQTPFPAILQAADLGTEYRHAVVIWKQTYRISDELLIAEDPMPITGDPTETEYGMFHGDIFLRKVGVDLCVLGKLKLSHYVTERLVTLRCGAFVHTLRLSGERVWVPSGVAGLLRPSSPQPFMQMELSYQRAFGGYAEHNGMPVPHADNPVGRGYYLTAELAKGNSLPNIERASDPPISSWQNCPAPAGWGPYPMNWGLRAKAAVTVDGEQGTIQTISPAVFNNAHPDLVLSELALGQSIELIGVYDRPVVIPVPRTEGIVHVNAGDEVLEVVPQIDGVYVFLEAERLVVTQRASFRYLPREEEVRAARLTLKGSS